MATLTEVFPCFFLSCKANARAKTRKDGARPALFPIFVSFYVFFALFYVFVCCSMYCLFCVVLCIVCVYMCIVLLPPAGYPIAVKYIISKNKRIKYKYFLKKDKGKIIGHGVKEYSGNKG